MPLGTGRGAQVSLGEETTYGTAATTITRGVPFLTESLDFREQGRVESNAIIGGSGAYEGRRSTLSTRAWTDGGGDITFEVGGAGFGVWLKHALGAIATTQPDATNSPTVYRHTATPGDLVGKSLTIQKGVPQTDGTVRPFTFLGSKVASLGLSVGLNQPLQASVTIDARQVVTTTALATPTYSVQMPFSFRQFGTLTVAGGAVAAVTAMDLTISQPMKTDRVYLGSSGLKAQQLQNDFLTITGTLTAEFTNWADFWQRYYDDVTASLVIGATGGIIEDAYNYALELTMPTVRFTGDTPKVGGPDVVTLDVPFSAEWNGTNPTITAVYTTSDATP